MDPSTKEPLFRLAEKCDVPAIVRLLADDFLGVQRETVSSPLPDSYYAAFDAIYADPNNELIVAELQGTVVGVLQATYTPCMSNRGGWKATLENVRVDSELRSQGIGRKLIRWVAERARQRNCHWVQLTSDKARTDAIRFYQQLGFVASHEGLKLPLSKLSAASSRNRPSGVSDRVASK